MINGINDFMNQKNGSQYEWQDDSNLKLRTEMQGNLCVAMKLDENLRIISDTAFEAMDIDGSGGLDVDELSVIME